MGGPRQWWNEWSATRSPWARARRRDERLAEAIAALPIATAERVVASWLDQAPIETDDPDLYNATFVRRRAGWAFGHHDIIADPAATVEDPRDVEEGARIVVWQIDFLAGYVRPGELAVRRRGLAEPVHPSVAHLAIAECVRPRHAAALEALALAPSAPVPPGPHVRRYPAPIEWSWHLVPALDDRARSWALIGASVSTVVGALATALAVFAVVERGVECGALVLLVFGIATVVLQGMRLIEVVRWEPRARRLAPFSERGFTHPDTGTLTPWSAVRRSERKWRRVVLVLSETERIVVPLSLFHHPVHAEVWLAQRVGHTQAPYRGR